MAAPTASYVRLADDSGNTGKKARTQSRVVGSDTVHEHFTIPTSKRSKLGVFHYASAVLSAQATAQDGTSTGHLWIQNPVGSAVTMIIRELELVFANSAATTAATAPRVNATKFTFTGTASGASVTPAKRKAADASPVGFIRIAVTGMTVVLGAVLKSFFVPTQMTAAGDMSVSRQAYPTAPDPCDDNAFELAAGEGLVIYQPDNGTASDPRRVLVSVVIEEVE